MLVRLNENKTIKVAAVSFLAITAAILLILGLFNYAKINPYRLLKGIQIIPAWALILIVLIMLLNIMIGAQNWRLVVEHVSKEKNTNPGYFFYLVYTALSAFLGLFIPIQVSTMIIRSASLRLAGFSSIKKSTVTALVSQFQDITIIILFLIPGIFVLFWKIHVLLWLVCVIILVGGGYLFFSYISNWIIQKICSFNIKFIEKPLSLLREGLNTGLFDNTLLIKLYHYSLLKFIILALQSYLLSWIIGLNISLTEIISISSVLRMSVIVAITPGNVGVAEWGWVGLLSLVGISTYDAGYFAITSTVLGYGSTIAVFAGTLIMFFFWKLCRFAGI